MKIFKPTFIKPDRTEYTDKLMENIISLLSMGYAPSKIEKLLKLKYLARRLSEYRKNSKWAGRIPYLKCIPRSVVDTDDRIGVLDIETYGDFNANRGFIISYSIKEHNKDKYHLNLINPKSIRDGYKDKDICENLIRDILKFDVIVGYYSGDFRFDLPFIRTRCGYNNIEFPYYNTIKQIDLYSTIKKKYKLTRNTLEESCKIFGIKGKSHVNYSVWEDFVLSGDMKCGREILEHNKVDTRITDELYEKIKNQSSMSLVSI